MENRPLVKYIRNYIRDLSGIFSISSLVRISMTSFPALTSLFVQKSSCLYNKKKVTLWLVFSRGKKQYFTHSMHSLVKYCFYHWKVKFISLRHRVISSIYHQSLGEGGGVLGSIFAGYVLLASPNPYPIIVYSLANLL